SRFEVVHAQGTDEFMAPTPQHCQWWVQELHTQCRSLQALSLTKNEAKMDFDLFDAMLSTIKPTTSPKLAKSWGSVSAGSSPEDNTEARKQVAVAPLAIENKATSPVVPRWTENEAEAQLDILVRVEGALKQLEGENKAAMARETELRQEIANLKDSVRLVNAEKEELLTQLRELALERDEWKGIARQKLDEVFAS
ncbi:hypothetical protein THRCLA_23411, partial [Thraustotheca clavata]